MFQYPYSHSTYFTRCENDHSTSELPPMNSTEDVLQVQFMHDRMMVQHEVERLVVWQAITRFTKDIKRGFRSSLQAIGPSRRRKRRISVVSTKSFKDVDARSSILE